MADRTETKGQRKPSQAFMKPVQPDEKLAEVIGKEAVPRTEVTRKLWDYIRQNNLQDQSNRTRINADAKLKEIFGGREQVTMFEMTKLVFEHVH
jgi:chromatin remodeling complex protein RSC6